MEYRHKHIIEYLKKNLKKGYTLESLRWALIGQGYLRTSVDRSIEELNKEMARNAPVLKEEPKIKYEIFDGNNQIINVKISLWKRIFNFFK